MKTLQNDLSLKDEVVARIENEVTENISLQPFRRLIGYDNQANPNVVITAIVIVVVAALLGFCKSSPETQLTNLENQGENKLKIATKKIDYIKRANDHYLQKIIKQQLRIIPKLLKLRLKMLTHIYNVVMLNIIYKNTRQQLTTIPQLFAFLLT